MKSPVARHEKAPSHPFFVVSLSRWGVLRLETHLVPVEG